MKYTVRNGSRMEVIGNTDSFIEALCIADDGIDCNTIYREDGIRYTVSEATEIIHFVTDLVRSGDWELQTITDGQAMTMLLYFSDKDIKQPRFMTSETFADVWNELVEEELNDPVKKEYLLKTVCEGIKQISIKTGKQIADIYEMDQIAGIYSHMEVWDVSGEQPVRISLIDLVEPILENKRWMEQEYRDYCENERYGD